MLSGCGCFPSVCPGAGTDLGLSLRCPQKHSDLCTALAPSCTVLVWGETSWFSLLQGGLGIFSLCCMWVSATTFPSFSLLL